MEENNCNLNREDIINSKIINIDKDNNMDDIDDEESEKLEVMGRKKSSTRIEKIITLDTLVYEILNPGESRNKNFDKISAEIKNVELMSKKEKAKLKRKINLISQRLNDNKESILKESKNNEKENNENTQEKILNIQMKKLMLMEYERDKRYNLIEVIQKLKIPPEKRKIRDILRIKTYIEQSKLGINYREEFTDVNIAEKLIHFCCTEMRYKQFKKNDVIIKIGDPPDSFYSIIFGKVKIIKPIPKTESLTGFQYFKYIMKMKKNDNYIFNQCIKLNKDNYHIEIIDSDIIRYVYLLKYFEHIKGSNDQTIELDKVLDLLDIKPKELGINPELVNNNYYIRNNLIKIQKKIPKISPDIMDQYSFIIDNFEKKEVITFENKQFLSLKTNDYFGDSSIETNSPRNATIIAEEDTDMAYLSNKLYSAQIATEKATLLQIRIKNMHQNFFFHRINYGKFSKKYFSLFINNKYNKKDIIFNQGDIIKYAYFIQEGSVELSLTNSMNDIESLINIINEKREIIMKNNYAKIKLNKINKNEYENLDNQNTDIERNIHEYNKINSTYKDLVEYLNQKKNTKVIILNSNEDIGIISYLLGNNYLCTCEVVSKKAKIYQIEIEYLEQILESEIEIKWDFFKRLKEKLKLFSERLFKNNNIQLVMTDEKLTQNKLSKMANEEKKEEIPANNTSIRTSINYDKINNLKNEQKEYNSIIINNSFNNSNIHTICNKTKKNEINLPILNSNINKNKNTFSFPSLNYNGHKIEHKSIRVNKLMKKGLKFNNIKILDVINKKEKSTISKKTLVEDNMLSKIQKDILSFSQNKYTLSKDKIKINISRNDFINKKDIDNKGKNKIYLTDLNPNKLRRINSLKLKEIEKNTNEGSPNIQEKMFDYFDRSITLENPRIKINLLKSNFRLLSNDNRLKTDNNILVYKNGDNSNNNNLSLNKKYNHPYYDPLTLIKIERYKIFDNKNFSSKSKQNYINAHLERIREIKKIRESMKNNFRYRFKFNINNKDDDD